MKRRMTVHDINAHLAAHHALNAFSEELYNPYKIGKLRNISIEFNGQYRNSVANIIDGINNLKRECEKLRDKIYQDSMENSGLPCE